MKIRIIKKGLPKAQMWNSQQGMQPSAKPNYGWMMFPNQDIQRPVPEDPALTMKVDPAQQPTPLTQGPVDQIMPYNNDWITREKANEIGMDMYNNLKPFDSRKEMKSFVNDYNKHFGTNHKVPFLTPDRAKLANNIGKVSNAIGMVGSAVDYFAQRQKAKEYQKAFRANQFDESVSPMFRGNHQLNTGVFQPNLLPPPNEGMLMYGGSSLNEYNMPRIKITGQPQMAYGGQQGYGFDLGGRRVYTDMPESQSDDVASTITSVPRYAANIEAEGGETIYGDMDGDGVNEHLKISGPRHSQGGVPLNVPEGSFIYSDTRKMKIKDPGVLAMFGKTYKKGGGYTPAELAKKYDINKFKAIMEDPNADERSKSTAQMMVKNYQDKLGMLALVQEEMKGFPQGIPEVAQGILGAAEMAYGGYVLPKAQRGLSGKKKKAVATISEEDIFNQQLIDSLKQQGYDIQFSPRITKGDVKVPVRQAKQKSGLYGDVQMAEIDELRARHPWYFENKPNWNPANPADVLDFQTKYDEEFAKQKGYSYFVGDKAFNKKDKKLGEYTYNAPGLNKKPPGSNQPQVKYKCTEDGGYQSVDVTPGMSTAGLYDSPEAAMAACKPIKPNENTFKGNEKPPFGYMTPDLVNMYANAAVPPSIIFGYRPKAPFEPGRYVLEDWFSKAQQRQQAFNIAANTAGTYGPTTGLAANLSFMAGQAGDAVAGDIAGVDSRNVDRANIALSTERQRKDQNNLFNLAQSQELWKDNAIAKQQFDNARRAYLKDIAKSYANAWNNRMNLGLINAVNPMYNIDNVSGRSYFKKGYDASKLGTMGLGANPNSESYWQNLNQGYLAAKAQFPDLSSGQYLSAMRVLNSSTDRNGDGIADSQTVRTASPYGIGGYVTYPF